MSSRVIFQGNSTRTQFLGVSSASYRRRNHVSCSDTTAIPSTKAVEAPYDAVIIGGGKTIDLFLDNFLSFSLHRSQWTSCCT